MSRSACDARRNRMIIIIVERCVRSEVRKFFVGWANRSETYSQFFSISSREDISSFGSPLNNNENGIFERNNAIEL